MLYPSNQQLIKEFFKGKITGWFADESDTELIWENRRHSYKVEQVNSRVRSFFGPDTVRYRKHLKGILKEIIKLANDNQIRVVGVKFPIDSLMNNRIHEICAYDSVRNVSADLGVKHFIDLQEKYQKSRFLSNEDHVNYNGAAKSIEDIVKYMDNLRN